jgi:type IV pilus assembly protein PilA
MYCSTCGALLPPQAAFCAACGATVPAEVLVRNEVRRPGVVTLLAVLQFIGAAFMLLIALGALVSLADANASDGAGMVIAALVLAVIGAGQLACGVGLIKLKPYGRGLQFAFAIIGLLGIPLGTIISILILVYLSKPGVKLIFSGRPAAEFSAAEWAGVEGVTRGSGATSVAMAAGIGVGAIVLIGIVAAIAVPGLMRARMSGNEASAIGSLRAINSAQTTYASSCGQGLFAGSLRDLARPPEGQTEGFVSPDLGSDPVVKSGYTVSFSPGDNAPAGTPGCNMPTALTATYFVGAEPTTLNSTGSRYFGTNQAGAIYQSLASPLPVTFEGQPPNSEAIR